MKLRGFCVLLSWTIAQTDGLSQKNGSFEAQSRRNFVRDAAALATGAASMPIAADAMANNGLQGRITLPPIGLGAWAWGDPLFWGYDKKNDGELKEVFDFAIQESQYPTTLLDTAEIYGFKGRSETLIGQFAKDYESSKIQVATKFAPLPFRTKADDVVKACEASLQRLGREQIDLYQIHFPNAYCNEEYWNGLAKAFDKGLVKAVGVSNYGVDAVRKCHSALEQRGIQLATNQIQLSLLYRHPLENGLMSACADLGIKVLAYSPLALGMLTGKYKPNSPPSGRRKGVYEKLLTTKDYSQLLSTMSDIASKHEGATAAQVAINWTRSKNAIPIPGARTISQIRGNYGATSWNLSNDEVAALDSASSKVGTFIQPDASPFPKKDINTGLVMFDS